MSVIKCLEDVIVKMQVEKSIFWMPHQSLPDASKSIKIPDNLEQIFNVEDAKDEID